MAKVFGDNVSIRRKTANINYCQDCANSLTNSISTVVILYLEAKTWLNRTPAPNLQSWSCKDGWHVNKIIICHAGVQTMASLCRCPTLTSP